jgi:1,4-alpha-glucan branching enzyme
VADLNGLYRADPALWEADAEPEGFEWIDFHDVEQSVVSFVRRAPATGSELVFACNFTPVPRHEYHVGVPGAGRYREVLNSDAAVYGGSNLGNAGTVDTVPLAVHGRSQSLRLTLPPLAAVVLRREADTG